MLADHRGEVRRPERGEAPELVERHLPGRQRAAVDRCKVGPRPRGPAQEQLPHPRPPGVVVTRVSGQQGRGDRLVVEPPERAQRGGSDRGRSGVIARRQVEEQAEGRPILELAQQVEHRQAVRLGRSAVGGDRPGALARRPVAEPGGQAGQGHVARVAIRPVDDGPRQAGRDRDGPPPAHRLVQRGQERPPRLLRRGRGEQPSAGLLSRRAGLQGVPAHQPALDRRPDHRRSPGVGRREQGEGVFPAGDRVPLHGPPQEERQVGVVAVPVARQQAIGHVEPGAGLEPSGRAGELGADRDVGLGSGHLDQPRRQPRGHSRLVPDQPDGPGADVGVGVLEQPLERAFVEPGAAVPGPQRLERRDPAAVHRGPAQAVGNAPGAPVRQQATRLAPIPGVGVIEQGDELRRLSGPSGPRSRRGPASPPAR